jgi:uncharacterized membrane protein YeaQ/YmgE (transglycosylase-associated protein family)
MSILTWLILGLIAGWYSGVIVRGGGLGLIGDVLIGMVGAMTGGLFAAMVFGIQDVVSGVNFASIAVALLCSIVTLSIFRLMARPVQEP